MSELDKSGEGGLGAAADMISESTHVSWFSKIIEALWGVLIGLALALASVVGLFWNEGRAVTTFRSLAEGASLVQSVDTAKVDPANAGKLIHVAGPITAKEKLTDTQLAIGVEALRLVRVVEMYQWKERRETQTVKNVGGSEERITRYYYDRVWEEGRIDSSRFKQGSTHANPEPRLKAATLTTAKAELGAFRPGAEVVGRLAAGVGVPPTDASAAAARALLGVEVHKTESGLYIGANPGAPQIGDMKVTFRMAPAGPVSIIGAQSGADIAPYQTKAGDRLLMVESGIRPAEAMFKAAVSSNRILTWALRAFGVIVMWIGWFLVLRPLVVVADVVPFFGNILGAGAGMVAFIITLVLAPLTMAVAWFFYRPLVALGIAGGGLLLAWLVRGRAAARAPAPVAVPAAAGQAAAAGAFGGPGPRKSTSFLPPRQPPR